MRYNALLRAGFEQTGVETTLTPPIEEAVTFVASGKLNTVSNLTYKVATNRLGIGTDNPSANLHVRHTATASVDIESTGTSGRRYTIFSTDSAASIGGGFLSIFDNSNSVHAVSLNGTTSTWRVPIVMNYGNPTLSLNSTGAGGRGYSIISTNNTSSAGGGRFIINDGIASSIRLTIDSTGNTGLGTTSPSSKLDVSGDIEVGAANWFYYGDPNTNGSTRMGVSGTNFVIQARQSGSWVTKQTFSIA